MKWLIAVCLAAIAPLLHADTYPVMNGADSGTGSLRQAILDANKHPGLDSITRTSAEVIVVKSPLPPITDPVQLGFGTFLAAFAIDGRSAGANADGLVLAADDCWLLGVTVGGFGGAGIVVRGKRAAVDTSFIGFDQGGAPLPNGTGIRIETGADAFIGSGARVFIRSNRGAGIDMRGGADISAVEVTSNGGDGLHVDGASSLKINSGAIIAANGGNGVSIAHFTNASTATFQLGQLGTPGGALPPNGGLAVSLDDVHDCRMNVGAAASPVTGVLVRGSSNIDIFVTERGAGADGVRVESSKNVVIGGSIVNGAADGVHAIDSEVSVTATISGNRGHGVEISGGSCDFPKYPGVQVAFVFAIINGNGGDGVHVERGKVTTTQATIYNNGGDGIALLDGTNDSTLTTDVVVRSNGGAGVRVDDSAANTLNMQIRDNLGGPLIINGSRATGNVVSGAAIEVELPAYLHGLALGPRKGRAGVLITGGASNNRITKTSIAFQGGPAVGIESGRGNHADALDIIAGPNLPIDLGLDGLSVTGETVQPAPVVEEVSLLTDSQGRTYNISGIIPGSHGGAYDLDVYSAVPAEWHTLATIPVVADASGRFSATFSTVFFINPVVFSATVTDSAGSTSEMSAPRGLSFRTMLVIVPQGDGVGRGDTFVARVDRYGSDLGRRATADWTATTDSGTIFAHGSVAFEPGEVRKGLTIDTKPLVSCSCTRFMIALSNVTGAAAGSGASIALMPFDDRGRVTVTTQLTQPEGDQPGGAVMVLTRHWSNGVPMTVGYHTESGTAKDGEDFAGVHGTITFAAGQREALVAVPIRGDRDPEPDESFRFVIDGVDGTPWSAGPACAVTLTDDDAVPVIDVAASGSVLTLTARNVVHDNTPAVVFDVVRLTPFGEQLIDHQAGVGSYAIDTKQGPVEVRLSSRNAKLSTRVVSFEQAADAAFVVDGRELASGKNETIRVARLTPADVPLDVSYLVRPAYDGSHPLTGTLHFNAGQQIGIITLAFPPQTEGTASRAEVDLLNGTTTLLRRNVDVVSAQAPLLTVSGALRDGTRACVTFDAAQPLPATASFNVRGDWQSMTSFPSPFDAVTIAAGSTHGAVCTDRTASGSEAWLNFEQVSNARLSANRVWIGIDAPTANGLLPYAPTLAVWGPTIEEPPSGSGFVDFMVTLSIPATSPQLLQVETIDGTAIAGRDYTAVVTSLSLAGGQTRAVVRVPILAAGGTPPDGKYFFLAVRDSSTTRAGVATIIPPGKGTGRRRAG